MASNVLEEIYHECEALRYFGQLHFGQGSLHHEPQHSIEEGQTSDDEEDLEPQEVPEDVEDHDDESIVSDEEDTDDDEEYLDIDEEEEEEEVLAFFEPKLYPVMRVESDYNQGWIDQTHVTLDHLKLCLFCRG